MSGSSSSSSNNAKRKREDGDELSQPSEGRRRLSEVQSSSSSSSYNIVALFDSFAETVAEALQYERNGGEVMTALKDERKSLQKKVEGLEYKLEAEKQRWQKLLEDANAGFDEEKSVMTEGKQKLLQELAALSEQATATRNQPSNSVVDELQSQIKAKDANLAKLRGLADTKDRLWRNGKAAVDRLQARLDSDENAAALAAQATARIAQLEQALAQKDAKVQELTSSLCAVTVERDEQSSQVRIVTNQVKQLLREAKLKNERIEELTEDHNQLRRDTEALQAQHTVEVQLRENAIAKLHLQLTTQRQERQREVEAATAAKIAAKVQSAQSDTREAALSAELERVNSVIAIRAGMVKGAVENLRRLRPQSVDWCEQRVNQQMPDMAEDALHFCVLNEFFKTCTTELAAGAAAASGAGGARGASAVGARQGKGSAAPTPAPAPSGAAAVRPVQTQSPNMAHGTNTTAKTVQPSRVEVPAVPLPAVAVPAVAAPATPVTKIAPARTTTPSQVLSRLVTPPPAPAPAPNAAVSAPVSTPAPVLPPPVSASHMKASATSALPVPPLPLLPPPQQPTVRALHPSAFLTTFSSQQTEEPSQQQQSSPVPSRRASPAFTPSSQADIMDLTGDD